MGEVHFFLNVLHTTAHNDNVNKSVFEIVANLLKVENLPGPLLPDCSIYVKVGLCGTALLTHFSPVSTGRADTYPVWLQKHDLVLNYQSAFFMICPRQCEDFPACLLDGFM